MKETPFRPESTHTWRFRIIRSLNISQTHATLTYTGVATSLYVIYLLGPADAQGRAAVGDAVEVERGGGVLRGPHLQEGETGVHADRHDGVGRLAEPHLDQRTAQVLLFFH